MTSQATQHSLKSSPCDIGTTFSRRQRLPISGEGESLFRVSSMLKFISQVNVGQSNGWDHYERYAKRSDCGGSESCSSMG